MTIFPWHPGAILPGFIQGIPKKTISKGLTQVTERCNNLASKVGLSMKWEPVRADHSIDRVVASITLPKAVDANTFDELVVAGRKIAAAHQLTDRIDLQDAIEVPPGQNVVIAFGNMVPPRRVVFRRLEADTNTAVEELSIGVRQLAFTTVRYRRWADFSHLITTVIAALEKRVR